MEFLRSLLILPVIWGGVAPFLWLQIRHDRWIAREPYRLKVEKRRAEDTVFIVGYLVIWAAKWMGAMAAGFAVLIIMMEFLEPGPGIIERLGWIGLTPYYLGGLAVFLWGWRITEALEESKEEEE